MAGAEKDEPSWTGFLKTQILVGNSTCKHPERPVNHQAKVPHLDIHRVWGRARGEGRAFRSPHKTQPQEPESPASKNANPHGRKRFP